jgi:hypothetical protein
LTCLSIQLSDPISQDDQACVEHETEVAGRHVKEEPGASERIRVDRTAEAWASKVVL